MRSVNMRQRVHDHNCFEIRYLELTVHASPLLVAHTTRGVGLARKAGKATPVSGSVQKYRSEFPETETAARAWDCSVNMRDSVLYCAECAETLRSR